MTIGTIGTVFSITVGVSEGFEAIKIVNACVAFTLCGLIAGLLTGPAAALPIFVLSKYCNFDEDINHPTTILNAELNLIKETFSPANTAHQTYRIQPDDSIIETIGNITSNDYSQDGIIDS